MLKKDKYIYVRLSQDQIDLLKKEADKNFMTMSSYLWHLVLLHTEKEGSNNEN